MATGLIPHPRALSDGLAAGLATLMGSIAGTTVTVAPTADRVEPGWLVDARLDGAAMGVLTIGLSEPDAERLASLVKGLLPDAEPRIDSVLGEVCAQVVAAFAQQPLTSGLTLIAGQARHSSQTPQGELVSYRLQVTPEFTPTINVWSHVERAAEPAIPLEPASAAPGWTEPRSASGYPANLDVILDIDLPLSVRFGESEMTLDALTKLGPGSVIDLRRSPDDPVDVLVNGRLVARGEVVVVSGNYGVRILEVVSAADRMRTMRA